MKKGALFFVFISLLLVINLSCLCFAAVSEISSNQTFNFNLTKSGFENYYAYSWSSIESQTLEGTQKLTWELNAPAESIKIESSEQIHISWANVYIGANSIRISVGGCAKCNVITKSLGKEEIVKKIVVSAKILKEPSEITPNLGRDHVLQKERLSASFSDNKNISENETINLGKVSQFSLELAEKHNGVIGNISYSLTSTNPYISIYFSDTNTTTTKDENSEVIAEFPEQIRTDLSINSTVFYPTTAGLVINTTILNGGNNPASLIKVAVYVDGRFFEDRIINSIVQRERIMKDFIYTEDLAPGLHNLTIILDPENNTIDTDRSNNIFFLQINLPNGSPTYEDEEPETPETFVGTKSFSGELDTELTKASIKVDVTGSFASGNVLKINVSSSIEGNDQDCIENPYVEFVSPSGIATKRVYIFQGMQCTKQASKCLISWGRIFKARYKFSPAQDDYIVCTRQDNDELCRGFGHNRGCFEEIRSEKYHNFFPKLHCTRTKKAEITKEFNFNVTTSGEFQVKVGIEKAWDCSEQGYSYASQEVGRFDVDAEEVISETPEETSASITHDCSWLKEHVIAAVGIQIVCQDENQQITIPNQTVLSDCNWLKNIAAISLAPGSVITCPENTQTTGLLKRECCENGESKATPLSTTYKCTKTYFTECSENPQCTKTVKVKSCAFWYCSTKTKSEDIYKNTKESIKCAGQACGAIEERDVKFETQAC